MHLALLERVQPGLGHPSGRSDGPLQGRGLMQREQAARRAHRPGDHAQRLVLREALPHARLDQHLRHQGEIAGRAAHDRGGGIDQILLELDHVAQQAEQLFDSPSLSVTEPFPVDDAEDRLAELRTQVRHHSNEIDAR